MQEIVYDNMKFIKIFDSKNLTRENLKAKDLFLMIFNSKTDRE